MKHLSDFDLIPGYLVGLLRNDAQHVSLSIWNTQSLVDARQTTSASMMHQPPHSSFYPPTLHQSVPTHHNYASLLPPKMSPNFARKYAPYSVDISYPTLKTGRSLSNIAVPGKNRHFVSSRTQDMRVLTRIRA
ncbi:hypothetical protein DXG01_013021 [Tephrocybe rancida]|nr:hypothetical protein DXG01_013021 [Tephrocybe rancida]